MRRRMGWRVWGTVVLAGCGASAGETVDPETLFSGQTGSPAARDCDDDLQCLDAASARAESVDPDLSVRSAHCEPGGCVAVFVGDEGCSPTPTGPFYDCSLTDAEVYEAWREELSEQCTPDGACPPPEDPEGAAPNCLDDAECEEPIATEAEAAGEGVSFRDVLCVDHSCQAMFELAGKCSPAATGPWYDCSLADDVIRDRYAEDTELPSEDFGGGFSATRTSP